LKGCNFTELRETEAALAQVVSFLLNIILRFIQLFLEESITMAIYHIVMLRFKALLPQDEVRVVSA
jgi:energy-coupling factor transporter transmembrane protein EcfT